jgi:hypothetical protein
MFDGSPDPNSQPNTPTLEERVATLERDLDKLIESYGYLLHGTIVWGQQVDSLLKLAKRLSGEPE